ncbi:hypothetical protein PHYBOEH_010517 [Phytophthora boehmeriae]|uniref:Uncharacterized protein n=1 Tax=Phytophthora boehmeriae TaxID=109152 RepID=A0A8T1X0Q5_9STRA|nr:hypothetical protein PHYBOEH_010517 [Phytophthora boehmeriae]
MPSADRFKAVRSDQTFRTAQQQPPRRYLSAGASPVALTPGFSSLSPLYPLPASPSSVSSSSTTLDDAVGRLFTRFLPTFFDLLEKYQYEKALLLVEEEEDTKWKSWTAFKVMLKLCASCESTYHLMKYLETEMVKTDTIEAMYGKLIVLMNHLADELKPMVARQNRHFSVHTPTPNSAKSNQNTGGEENTDPNLMMEIAMCGDMSYYVELLEQGAEFFSVSDEMATLERNTSGVSLNSSCSPASETASTFRRLFSHSSLLRRGGLTSALPIRRGLVQKPGDPYISSNGANSSVPSNTLEQLILGGGVNGADTPGGGSNGLDTSQGGVNNGGARSTNPLAAEMMASSMEMQERNDGFMHGERRQKTTYHIAQVDEAMFLVLLVEGAKKTNEKVAQDFIQTVTENLQHSGAFGPRVLAPLAADST